MDVNNEGAYRIPEEFEARVAVARRVLTEVPGARSPLVLFDRGALTGQVELWRRSLGSVEPHFAIKACDAIGVLAHFHSLGLSFDAATAGEIRLLERIGVPAERVICTHPIRDPEDLEAIARYRPRALVVENASELRKLLTAGVPNAEYSPELFLRIELPFGGLSGKFGAEVTYPREGEDGVLHFQIVERPAVDVFAEALAIAEETGFSYGRLGFSSHVGTNTFETDKYKAMLRVFSHLRTKLAEKGIEITLFDLGGGYCDPEAPLARGTTQEAFLAELGAFLDDFQRAHAGVDLIAEPGRFMVSNSGSVVVGVMQADERRFLAQEDGTLQRVPHLKVQMNDGLYGNLLGERHDDKTWRFVPFRPSRTAPPHCAETLPAILNGKTCDSWDRLARSRSLPRDLRAGDQLLVPNAGAYTLVTATDFNSAPRSQVCLYSLAADGELVFELLDARGQGVDPSAQASAWLPPREDTAAAALSRTPGLSQMPTLTRIVGSLAGTLDARLLRPGALVGADGWPYVLSLVAKNDVTLQAKTVEPLAEGGMGWVLRLTEEGLDRPVALKIGKVPADGTLGERFRAEAAKTAELKDDPRIPTIFRFGTLPEGGHPFYTMEFVSGQTVEALIPSLHTQAARADGGDDWRRGERRRALERLRDVAQALAFAHERGVLHRDVKPANLMIPDDPRLAIKVLDWGLLKAGLADDTFEAGLGADTAGHTRLGAVLGTVDYMSPEQARGERVTEATDVWALGACLYRVLCNRLPLEHHGDEDARLAALRSSDVAVAEPARVAPDVPLELRETILKALRPRPEQRYASMAELAADLDNYLAHRPVDSYREARAKHGLASAGYRVSKAVERRPRLALGIVATLVLVLLATAGVAWRFSVKTRIAIEESEVAEASLDFLEDFLQETVEVSDGRVIQTLLERWTSEAESTQLPTRVQMRLFAELGKAYINLEHSTKAGELVARAYEWGSANLDPRSEERAEQVEVYATVVFADGDLERSQELMAECLALREELYGPAHRETIRTLAKLSSLYAMDDRSKQHELLSEALERARSGLGATDPLTCNLQLDLGDALTIMNRLDAAQELLLDGPVQEWLTRKIAADPSAKLLQFAWARLKAQRGDFDGARVLLEEILEAARAYYGERSPATARIQSELATIYERLGRYEEALTIQRELMAYAEHLFPDPLHVNRLAALNNLALFESRLGQFDAADERFATLHAGRVTVFGPGSALVAQALLNWGTNDSLAGREEAAEERLREALRIYDAAAGRGHAETITTRRTLGIHLRNYGHFEAAEPFLVEVVGDCEASEGRGSVNTWTSLRSLIDLYMRWGRAEQAKERAEQYLEWARADPEHRVRAEGLLEQLGGVETE